MAVDGGVDQMDEQEVSNDEVEEDVEPKLTYERIKNDLKVILRIDSASFLAVHSKFIALGTHWGKIHILDHQGNNVQGKELSLHVTTVNYISIDEKGEYFVSCSDDKIVVYGLYTSDNNYQLISDRPVRSVAIDPYFTRQGFGKRFISGDDKILLHEKGFLSRYKSTVLQQGRGQIRNIKWKGQFVAWASDSCAKIYDIEDRVVITLIEREKEHDLRIRPELLRCCFCWKSERTLLVGWGDNIKICNIKPRLDLDLKNQPRRYVELTSIISINYIICGIAPIENNLAVLCLNKDTTALNDSLSSHPQLLVIEPVDTEGHKEISSDFLSPRQFIDNKISDYHFEYLNEEEIYFIVSPKDIISVKPREEDDHVTWLLQHKQFSEALEVVKKSKSLKKHTLLGVGRQYINHLFEEQQYETAAKLCPTIFGTQKSSWEEEIVRFAQKNQLRTVAPHLPKGSDLLLDPAIYEMVLHDYLKHDSKGFLKIIREWPSKLYSKPAIVNATIDHLTKDPKNEDLLEALAELYTREGKHEKALFIYLEIGNKNQVFDLIRNYGLFSVLKDKLELLMQLNADEAAKLLFEHQDKIPVQLVVNKLKGKPKLLCAYLDRIVQRDPELCSSHHQLLVELYAQHAPQKLLPFLKSSNNYSLEKALDICRRKNLFSEVVFLLGRMGNIKEALQYITDSLDDIDSAIEFCKEHNDAELWEDLIKYSLAKPCFIRVLLQNIGTHMADPIALIRRIPKGMEIEGLMQALVKILQDYNLQISLEEGCKRVLVADSYSLLEKFCKQQRRGVCLTEDRLCHGCQRKLFAREIRHATDIVIFNCRHAFHEICLSVDAPEMACVICIDREKREFKFS